MKIISTNIGKPVTIHWNGEERITGIYKTPVDEGIYIGSGGVKGDTIGNPKVHGGTLKAAYLFSEDWYDYWKELYPTLTWGYGMFGENLTVGGLDETGLLVGSVYRIGEIVVRITAPREPCFKLGLRFEDQGVVDAFIKHGHPGTYISVVKPGYVRKGDTMELLENIKDGISIAEFYRLLYAPEKDQELIFKMIESPWLSENKRRQFRKWIT